MASYQVNPLEILDTTNSTGVGSGGSLTVGGGVSIGKDTHIGGNITVSGTSASFSDNIIVLNSGATTSQDTGLLLERASTDVSAGNNYSALVYSETSDEFRFGYATSDTRGTITLNSYVPIRTGGVYAGDSQIDNISVGNLNFNTLYQNGVPYIGSSQWTTTTGNTLTYTSGSVILSQQLSANNNSNTLGNIFTTGGNVGIGIAPTSKLHVHATDFPNIKLTTDNVYVNSIDLDSTNKTGGVYWRLMSTHQDASEGQGKFVISQVTSGLDVLGLTSSGNVGIRTLNPSTTLDVTGTGRITTSLTTGALYSTNVTSTNVVSTNVTSTNVVSTNVTSTNVVSTNVTSTNLVSTNVTSTSIVSTNVTSTNIIGMNITGANVVVDNIVVSRATMSNLELSRMTVSNMISSHQTIGSALVVDRLIATSNYNTLGNIFTTGGNVGIATTSPETTLDISGTVRVTTSLTSGALYSTNVTSTNVVGTNISSSTLNLSTGVTSANAQITNANITTSSIGTLLNTNMVSTNISSGALALSTGITSANAQITNLNANSSTIGTFVASSGTVGGHLVPSTNVTYDLGSSSLRWRDIYLSGNTIYLGDKTLSVANDTFNIANIAATTANLTTSTIGTIINTNTVSTNISSSTLTLSTGLTSGSAQVTNLNATTSTIGTVLNTNAVSTNISSGTLNLSTGLTSASIQVTNENVTTSTIATLRNTNAVSTNISSGTLNLSTGMTSANAQITNFVSTNISTSTLVSSTVSSNVISSTNYTGSNMSLSGNLNVAGTLTTVNITSTNLVNTNVSAGIVVASTSLSATGTSNTIGNIFTTGGNVGIGTSSPAYTLDINGTIDASSITTGNVSTGISTIGTLLNTNAVSTNISSGTLNLSTGLTSASVQTTNLNATTSTIATARVTTNLLAIGNSNTLGNIFTTGGNVGIATTSPAYTLDVNGTGRITNLNSTTSTIATLLNTNAVSTNISSGTLNLSTGLTSASIQVTNENATTSTIATLRNTNAVSTNISSGTLNLSTGLTSASIQVTNENATTSTIGTLRNTNTITTNISSGTLNLSTGLTSASIQVTNLNATTSTIATLLNTNVVSTNISSGTLNLSTGLTSASIQVTNENATTSTIGTARVATSLLAIGNSNTIGNIFTTGGNVGIVTTSPVGALDVRDATNFVGDDAGALYITGGTNGNRRLHMGYHNTNNYGWIEVVEKGVNLQNLSLQPRGGNVGIGTTSPAYLLDVNGTIDALTVTTGNVSTGVATIGTLLNTNAVATNISTSSISISSNTTIQATTNNYSLTSGSLNIAGDIVLSGTELMFAANAFGPPSMNGRGSGSKIVLYPSQASGSGDFSIGIDTGTMWFQVPLQSHVYRFYHGTTANFSISTNGNVGIGTISPGATLDVTGTGRITTSLTTGALYSTNQTTTNIVATNISSATLQATTGITSSNIRIQSSNPQLNIINTTLGNESSIAFNNSSGALHYIGNNVGACGVNNFGFYINGSTRMTLASSGNIGIGTTVPSYKLHVVGDIYASGDITAYSDARLKTNIATITNPLDKVDLLRGVYYTHIETQKESIGLIAQETLEVLPEVVATKGDYLGINYGNIVGLLVEAIKELRQEIKELKNQIN